MQTQKRYKLTNTKRKDVKRRTHKHENVQTRKHGTFKQTNTKTYKSKKHTNIPARKHANVKTQNTKTLKHANTKHTNVKTQNHRKTGGTQNTKILNRQTQKCANM